MTTKDLIIKEITELPPEAQKLVREFIGFLKRSLGVEDKKPPAKRKSVLQGKFIGMWKDREEMKDSVEYVRKLRREQWGRKPHD